MQVHNAEDTPIRIVADARLLWLEVTPRGARKAERCDVPADMRPTDDLSRTLVVPAGGSYVEDFDPRLYCFGARGAALEPQAVVVAHLGWAGRRTAPPFEVSSVDGADPVGPAKALDSPPVGLPDEPTAAPIALPAPAPAHPAPALDAPRVTLRSAEWVDAATPDDVTIPVTLTNEGSHPVVVRLSPETLSFEATRATRVEACPWPGGTGAAVREAFTTIPAHGRADLSVVLRDYCTGHALDQSGLVSVRARLDTRSASGTDVGLQTFDGLVVAGRPTLVRLHRGAAAEVRPRPVAQLP
jgi:hypothetical protein